MVRKRRTPPDGRVNSGGARQGAAGTAYAQRSDLNTQKIQKIQTPPSKEYGQATALRQAQQAVPLPATPPILSPSQGQAGGVAGPPPDLWRPTERPGEPVTHGLPTGPGAGPEALPIQPTPMGDPAAIQIRAMLRANPSNQELANLVADMARGV